MAPTLLLGEGGVFKNRSRSAEGHGVAPAAGNRFNPFELWGRTEAPLRDAGPESAAGDTRP
jgi:hypothetical protein